MKSATATATATAAAATPCSIDAHEALKCDPTAWRASTYAIGDGTPMLGLEWRNCSACHSTLARLMPHLALVVEGP